MSLINVNQIYFLEQQRAMLDPAFSPFDNTLNPRPELYETHVFEAIYHSLDSVSAEYIGVFSYKFNQKMLCEGKDFITFVENTPGADVYVCEPYPQDMVFFSDIWARAEKSHPGIIDAAQHVFDFLDLSIDLKRFPRKLDLNCNCNFWVGRKSFWNRYIPILLRARDFMINQNNRRLYFGKHSGVDGDFFFFPYIIERLLTTYLVLNPEVSVKKFAPILPISSYLITPIQVAVYKKMVSSFDALSATYGVLPDGAREIHRVFLDLALKASNLELGRASDDWSGL